MAVTKTVSSPALDNDYVLVAGAADHTSSVLDLSTAYPGSGLMIKLSNGATGPTVAAQAQVWVSADNSNWFKNGGAYAGSTTNGDSRSWPAPLPPWAKYAKVISGSNTGQNVTIRVEGVVIADVMA